MLGLNLREKNPTNKVATEIATKLTLNSIGKVGCVLASVTKIPTPKPIANSTSLFTRSLDFVISLFTIVRIWDIEKAGVIHLTRLIITF